VTKLTRHAYGKVIEEDLAWLKQQPKSLERDHIVLVLEESERNEYGEDKGVLVGGTKVCDQCGKLGCLEHRMGDLVNQNGTAVNQERYPGYVCGDERVNYLKGLHSKDMWVPEERITRQLLHDLAPQGCVEYMSGIPEHEVWGVTRNPDTRHSLSDFRIKLENGKLPKVERRIKVDPSLNERLKEPKKEERRAGPIHRDGHDGDCTIYASLINNSPTDGICTCGYGWRQVRKSNWDHMYSEEREAKMMEGVSPEDVEKSLEDIKKIFGKDNQKEKE